MLRKNLKIGLVVVSSVTLGIGIYQGIEVRNGYRKSAKMEPPDGPISGTERFILPKPVDKIVQSSMSLIQKSKEKVILLNEKIIELNKEMKGNYYYKVFINNNINKYNYYH
jgi:hypothetical protein